ncbi:TetR/AcrR family transcriptional regulator [Neptunomonas phycophila]|uniref:TetR/AcrR family transcriptional regulator n=1 Tax=Neptunomonas phycophila TaxID=1572645 RepID=A0AAW7XKL3_9GAMM|nr:TetR/AcrR family transcriptional regulator [Neptunomonas phycophila]MDO6454858.1 TetR/AcrR family transcriptional regulator [Neptunomonas phycophila]
MSRPSEFDRQKVLDKAMHVFWSTGYSATSVNRLVDATELQPGSLYGAFKSKKGLFLEVIDVYANRSLARIRSCLTTSPNAIDGIEQLFLKIAEEMKHDNTGKGCLMVNTLLELANRNDEIVQKVIAYLSLIESLIKDALLQARQNGEIDKRANCTGLAKTLVASIWGLRVMSATNPSSETYDATVQNFMKMIPRI